MSNVVTKIQRGFTLIELVIVIAILGILAAVAIPKYLNLSGDAYTATVQGIAGALGSASASNYVIRTVNSTRGSYVATCSDIGSLLTNMPSGYSITASALNSGSQTCLLLGPSTGVSATFIGTQIS